MSFGDLFKGKENTQLKARVAQLEAMLTPEMQDSLRLQGGRKINNLKGHILNE